MEQINESQKVGIRQVLYKSNFERFDYEVYQKVGINTIGTQLYNMIKGGC